MQHTLSISNTFSRLKNQCALVPFITAGDPNLSVTEQALKILAEEGADMIELGIPYSDPLADGPVIQAASARAIQNGVSFEKILVMVTNINKQINVPLVVFTYYNLVLNHGIENFISRIRQAGFKGILVPDLPLEEIDFLEKKCREYDLELILLISPNSSNERIRKITQRAKSCIYLVSSTGVTGMGFNYKSPIKSLIHNIKKLTHQALIVGFGISTAKDIKVVQSWGVDGIVMGSSFVKKLFTSSHDTELSEFRKYCQDIKKSINNYV
uniref:tryptophan synthase alpha subunit n=1 Tax=Rhodaphanes brevistipitata TaxID=446136 RepID=UPI001FCD9D6B|nr:tryptophan synthase alpha subunit [Rhodaphanes brevistipitata]UNJ18495.1 tryptophan synthase alpha subunit [Rhodaphanes brevistipitata]